MTNCFLTKRWGASSQRGFIHAGMCGMGGQGEGESCKSLDFGSIVTDYLKEKPE
jgi:hypothetical protein